MMHILESVYQLPNRLKLLKNRDAADIAYWEAVQAKRKAEQEARVAAEAKKAERNQKKLTCLLTLHPINEVDSSSIA